MFWVALFIIDYTLKEEGVFINSICGSWLFVNRRGCGRHHLPSVCVPVPSLSSKDLGGKR